MRADLTEFYEVERVRLSAFAEADRPAGEYLLPVFGTGNDVGTVMLIGEAPGAEEVKASRPFVGKAGHQLDELFSYMGLSRDDIFLTNAVKYRPVVRTARGARNRTPGKTEIMEALPLLKKEILSVRPIVIATLGNTPLKAIYTLAEERVQTIGNVHGRPIKLSIDSFAFELFPLYHPASCIYDRMLKETLEADARTFGEHLENLGGVHTLRA